MSTQVQLKQTLLFLNFLAIMIETRSQITETKMMIMMEYLILFDSIVIHGFLILTSNTVTDHDAFGPSDKTEDDDDDDAVNDKLDNC